MIKVGKRNSMFGVFLVLALAVSLVKSTCHKSCATCSYFDSDKCTSCASGYKVTNNASAHPSGCESVYSITAILTYLFYVCVFCCCCILPCTVVITFLVIILTCGLGAIGLGAKAAASTSGAKQPVPMKDMSMNSSVKHRNENGTI